MMIEGWDGDEENGMKAILMFGILFVVVAVAARNFRRGG
ncbi:hypothetical protein SAMN05421771_2661 [Granulicella pectinivorans]|jgi:hypothetical protein|uniref:Uncharacterized protein n=1 Tax=Granulicella pectinivorans TaxID=474950 RepID=A0A1I6MHI5_9BACT|nr:hypothetical protein SAMN05421771_2661 [Granulicella pectinivorans]